MVAGSPLRSRRPAVAVAAGLLLGLAVLALLLGPRRLGAVGDALLSPFVWRSHAAARPTPNGGLILGWSKAAGANGYIVKFLADDGREIDRIDGIETLEVVLTREALPRHLRPGSVVRWSVVALAGGREKGKSPPQPLRLP